jgi:hypothetical protein
MKTTIDNNQRVFHVVTSTGKQAFCNLSGLNEVIKDLGTHEGYFKIFHYWNNRPQRVTKKYLKDMFKANGIRQDFIY